MATLSARFRKIIVLVLIISIVTSLYTVFRFLKLGPNSSNWRGNTATVTQQNTEEEAAAAAQHAVTQRTIETQYNTQVQQQRNPVVQQQQHNPVAQQRKPIVQQQHNPVAQQRKPVVQQHNPTVHRNTQVQQNVATHRNTQAQQQQQQQRNTVVHRDTQVQQNAAFTPHRNTDTPHSTLTAPNQSGNLCLLWLSRRHIILENKWISEHMLKLLDHRTQVHVDVKRNTRLDELPLGNCSSPLILVAARYASIKTRKIPAFVRLLRERLREHNAPRGFKIGAIHLSDETCDDDTTFYSAVDFVFRNYWCAPNVKQFDNSRVHYFPLGITKGFAPHWMTNNNSNSSNNNNNNSSSDNSNNSNNSNTSNGNNNNNSNNPGVMSNKLRLASERPVLCSFVGDTQDKPRRIKMIKVLKRNRAKLNCLTRVTDGFYSGLTGEQFAELLDSTAFTLCPKGINEDQFRIWEALESGSIPIAEFGPSFLPLPEDNQIPLLHEWRELIQFMKPFQKSKAKLDEKQKQVLAWYKQYKRRIQELFKFEIDNHS